MKMNPLCLLTKGRTFKDMADRSGAYKMLARSYLPKFNPSHRAVAGGRNPAPEPCQTALFEAPPVEAPVAVAVETPRPTKTPEPVVEPVPSKALSKSPFAIPPAKPAPKESVIISANFKGGLWARFFGFIRELLKRLTLSSKSHSVQRPSVQTELALEKVIPLRNDLNEDDLEIVLVDKKNGTGEKPLARLSKVEMTGEAWSKLTAPFRRKEDEPAMAAPAVAAKGAPELTAASETI